MADFVDGIAAVFVTRSNIGMIDSAIGLFGELGVSLFLWVTHRGVSLCRWKEEVYPLMSNKKDGCLA
jgi:hypothetical protein